MRGGDYVIPDSQVSIGGRSGGSAAFGGLGLMGLAIGQSIDAGLNQATIGKEEKNLALRFDAFVTDLLRKRIAAAPQGRQALRVAARVDPSTQVEVLTSARFFVTHPPGIPVLFFLDARFASPGSAGRANLIHYLHLSPKPRPFTDGENGWADQGGAPFRTVAYQAFDRLAAVFLADLRGELRRNASDLKRVRWQSLAGTQPVTGLLLYEQADYIAAMPMFGETPSRNRTVIVERSVLLD